MDSTLVMNKTSIEKTAAALKERGIAAEIVDTRAEASCAHKGSRSRRGQRHDRSFFDPQGDRLRGLSHLESPSLEEPQGSHRRRVRSRQAGGLAKAGAARRFFWEAFTPSPRPASSSSRALRAASSGRTPTPHRTSYGSSERRRSSRASIRASTDKGIHHAAGGPPHEGDDGRETGTIARAS